MHISTVSLHDSHEDLSPQTLRTQVSGAFCEENEDAELALMGEAAALVSLKGQSQACTQHLAPDIGR